MEGYRMRKEESEKITELIETSMKNLTSMVDVNTIMGSAIKTENGSYIIPVSKVTVAFITGGGEYGKVKIIGKDEHPFVGGSGAIVSMKPCGFLLNDALGEYKMLTVDNEPMDKIFDIVGEYIKRKNI
jgi:sporulation protein YtfJ